MRFFLSATALVVILCTASSAQAQLNILGGAGTPTPAPRLVTTQDDELTLDSPAKAANPFDFFAEEEFEGFSGQAEVSEPQQQVHTGGVQPPLPTPPAIPSPSSELQDPGSLNVGLGHRRRDAGNAIAAQAMVASVPNTTYAPIHWGYQTQTPNPVAEILLRQQCVNGLWAGYQAQRQMECAAMWEHLNGHHCGTCAGHNHGCAAPINRYTQARRGCDTSPGCGVSSCDGTCSTCTASKPLDSEPKQARRDSNKIASQILTKKSR